MEQRRLLYIINHMDWFWSHRLPLARGAQAAGFKVLVAAAGVSADEKLAQHGFTGLDLPASARGLAPLAVFRTIWRIHELMRDQQPGIVHAITLKYAFMTGLAARAHKNIRAVHTIAGLGYLFSSEGLKPKILRALTGPLLNFAFRTPRAEFIFQNPDDQKIMIARGFVKPEQCHLIRGSGVDLEQFAPRPDPQNAVPVIVMPTRLVHDKGVAVFVQAARLLKQRGMHARFQIAGGITQNNPLAISENEMKAMVADGATQWLGKVSDMPALLASADLIAYPSYYREGVPKVLLEAAAMGKAIITTDHPGCREVVAHGVNGLLVPVKDAAALADAIEALLKNPKRRAVMGAEGRRLAERQFDVRMIVEKTLAVYHSSPCV